MSILKQKSSDNYKAAELLITKQFYSSSVHCSYYSCLQLVKHIIMSSYSKTEDDIYDAAKNHEGKQIKNSHEVMIDFIRKRLKEKSAIFDLREYNNLLVQLKNLRNESDYEEKVIDESISLTAKHYSDKVIKILNKNFQV